MALADTLPPDLRTLIERGDWVALARAKERWPDRSLAAPEVAERLGEMEGGSRALLFLALPGDLAAEVLSWLDAESADALLLGLTDAQTRALLSRMSPDDRTALLEDLPAEVTRRLLGLLPPQERAEAFQLLGYPPESVGRLMSPDYVAVLPHWTVGRALEEIRRFGRESETLGTIYVTDAQGRLVDALSLQRFVLATPDTLVGGIMDNTFVSISALDDREEAVRRMQRYHLPALPVVDAGGQLLGIVTIDDALEVAQEEATEDFQLASAVTPLKRGYWEAGAWRLLRSRIGWLLGLLFANLLSAGVIASFEQTLAAFVAITFFIPLVIACGGNTGMQAATILIRSLSTGEVHPGQWARVLLREVAVGAGIGLLLGLAGLALGFLRGGPGIGVVVLLTLVTIALLTNLLGAALPFLFARLGLDPAMASGPLIATVADAAGLLIYFSYAVLVL